MFVSVQKSQKHLKTHKKSEKIKQQNTADVGNDDSFDEAFAASDEENESESESNSDEEETTADGANPEPEETTVVAAPITFASLGLCAPLVDACAKLGWFDCN